ncbi:pyrroline-5-carboxylate reductase family protein [Sinorhizobium americanum]|uniref:Pyrroline-5-carboxylate reductase n=1 Tax=Sinorhizobium americanum TaxID=194963 RepID=A0A1L3LIZ9_9HYPH|nr:pyrroline-5-carboxylate reductase dimerization domain-containing protein [Sinorhizobium americanum]APG83536.1 pyrroline-5-carboxylate reductase protein ProC [Sinorhizobium americanum CCGM7]APG90071.1 pyrroline-5-carboxylate reductase protein ProC [Sinorhizobium americanum]OAP42342.1 pyrroline-5-carboxylate reductase [Sinorhizobium americanum]
MGDPLKIGIIGGGGWLGGAIAASILDAGLVQPRDLSLSYRREQPHRFAGSFWTTDSQRLADRSDVIIVSVRPADWQPLAVNAGGKLVISVMAGIRLRELAKHHNTDRVVRSLPNAAAEVGKSYTPWIGSEGVNDQDRAIVRATFDACGAQDEVASENDIDYLTGLSGSGPAFPALLADAMMRDAVSRGITPDVARRAVTAVLVGSGRLFEKSGECPAYTVEAFVGYRGTTAAAIEAMRDAGFDAAVRDGLAAAFQKSVDMGNSS